MARGETLQHQLRRTAKEAGAIATHGRKLLADQLRRIEGKLDVAEGEALSELEERTIKIIQAMDRTVEQSSKLLVTKNVTVVGEGDPDRTTEQIMSELQKGKK